MPWHLFRPSSCLILYVIWLFWFRAKYFYVFSFRCLLFYVTGIEKWNLFSFQMMVLKHLHFCLSNHACVSHLLLGQPHLLECYYQNCLIGTHMCVHPVSEWSVFFTLRCELFTSCNVSNNVSLVSARAGEKRGSGGVVNQMWIGLDRGRGGPKNSQIAWPLSE